MSEVEFSREGHVAHVRLNRPEALNAINAAMEDRLALAWAEINADPAIWAAVLSATGPRSFCVGADISGGDGLPGAMAFGGGLTGVGGPLVSLRKPLIAAVQGYVLGGGFELAMCADIIIAADSAQFGLPETRAGIIGECGVVHRAVRRLPHAIAMAMILTGERIDAVTAERHGLVNEIVPYEDLDAAAARWTNKLLAASPLANQAAKEAALMGLDRSLPEALASRYPGIDRYADSEDRREGRAAFAEKRPPVWSGR